jgi:hypothetical protein
MILARRYSRNLDLFAHSFLGNKNLLYLIALVYLFVALFPGLSLMPITPGLDPSWIYAINYIPHSNYVFGRDVVFTFGPLGYLLWPLDVGNNLYRAAIFRFIIHVLLVFLVCYHISKSSKTFCSLIGFVIASTTAIACGLYYEYRLLVVLALLLLVPSQDRKIWLGTFFLSSFLCALFLFMKFSLGVAGLAMLVTAVATWVVSKTAKAYIASLLAFWIYYLVLLLCAMIFMGSWSNFARWIKASLEIVQGYSVAMSIPGPKEVLVLGLLTIITYVVLLFIYRRISFNIFQAGILFVGALCVAFKHGFVRQDGHVALFFTFIIAVMGVLFLCSSTWTEVKATCIAFFIILILSLPPTIAAISDPSIRTELMKSYLRTDIRNILIVETKVAFCVLKSYWRIITGIEGFTNIKHMVNLDDVRTDLHNKSQMALQKDVLPDAWVHKIKSCNGTVDVLPWEITYCPANNLNWNPNPVLQLYSAYTSFLDRWSSIHYSGENAPSFLVVEFTDIDDRHLILDAPATWQTILQNYKPVENDSKRGRLLLEKEQSRLSNVSLTMLKEDSVKTGEWIIVPPSNRLLFAETEFKLHLVGEITKAFFRIDPVFIELVYDSGKSFTFRIIPNTARNGLLVNYLPTNSYQLESLMNGIAEDRVVKFRFLGPGLWCFNRNIHIRWLESNFTMKYGLQSIDPQKLAFLGYQESQAIDTINGLEMNKKDPIIIVGADPKNSITITGWAVDDVAKDKAGGVFINIDDQLDIPALYGLDRPDVAEHFKNKRYRFSGFAASFSTSILEKGRHTLSLKIVTTDKKGYYVSNKKILLEIK